MVPIWGPDGIILDNAVIRLPADDDVKGEVIGNGYVQAYIIFFSLVTSSEKDVQDVSQKSD